MKILRFAQGLKIIPPGKVGNELREQTVFLYSRKGNKAYKTIKVDLYIISIFVAIYTQLKVMFPHQLHCIYYEPWRSHFWGFTLAHINGLMTWMHKKCVQWNYSGWCMVEGQVNFLRVFWSQTAPLSLTHNLITYVQFQVVVLKWQSLK